MHDKPSPFVIYKNTGTLSRKGSVIPSSGRGVSCRQREGSVMRLSRGECHTHVMSYSWHSPRVRRYDTPLGRRTPFLWSDPVGARRRRVKALRLRAPRRQNHTDRTRSAPVDVESVRARHRVPTTCQHAVPLLLLPLSTCLRLFALFWCLMRTYAQETFENGIWDVTEIWLWILIFGQLRCLFLIIPNIL